MYTSHRPKIPKKGVDRSTICEHDCRSSRRKVFIVHENKRRPRWLLLTVFLLGPLAVIAALSVPSGADSLPNVDATHLADSNTHTYCNTASVTQTGATWYAMTTLRDTTDMTILSVTCNSNTDVQWEESNLSGTLRGSTLCLNTYSSGACNRFRVRLDITQINIGSWDWYDLRKTAVHELGHTTGLGHYQTITNAMKSGSVNGTALAWRRYEAHDVWHLNNDY